MHTPQEYGTFVYSYTNTRSVKGIQMPSKSTKSRAASIPQLSARPATRNVTPTVQCRLWGRAAGRCEFADCNKPLWKSSVTQEPVNISQKAHIYAFSKRGPRGNRGFPKHLLNSEANLMLVCHECHKKLDNKVDGGRYPAELMQRMKSEHEKRIELVTGIKATRKSMVLLYGANIGKHSSPLNYEDAATSLFPERYPSADNAIELSTLNSSFNERDASFWSDEAAELTRKFERRVRERISDGELQHLSVFAIAPQPLLVLLGTMLGDIVPSEVYQRHREPATWAWPTSTASMPTFVVQAPNKSTGAAALVIALSATVANERVIRVLGKAVSVWSVTVPVPHNDIIKAKEQLSQFRAVLRPLLDQIKAVKGQTAPLHIFLASPVSIAVELGRVRMPKADMPWVIYDEVRDLGGFVHALSIPTGGQP